MAFGEYVRFWTGRRVVITGHMGFKGSWLTYLLSQFGARTYGFGVDSRPDPLLYRKLTIRNHVSVVADLSETERLRATIQDNAVDTVFHLAAQSLVLPSYKDPLGTFQTNVLGTANVLDALRSCPSVTAAVIVTSDKVYANKGWVWPYREDDPLGGYDPYSASKAAAEIITQSMAASFFAGHQASCRVATVRAGNIIGGGDWAAHRLIADAARAYSSGQTLLLRNPDAVRPWQHVLEPLAGYLLLMQRLVERESRASLPAWNFGPQSEDAWRVRAVAEHFTAAWGGGAAWTTAEPPSQSEHEAATLRLDSSRARLLLGWTPRWRIKEAIERTARWYRDYYAGQDAQQLVQRDLDAYFA